MTGKLLPLGLGITLGLLLPGCRGVRPDASVERAPQACCTSADSKLQRFKGCRLARGNCRSLRHEKFWMRGHVVCGPVDEDACEGGRCCRYEPQYDASINRPIENWAPPGFEAPTNNVTDPGAAPQHELPGGQVPVDAGEGPAAGAAPPAR